MSARLWYSQFDVYDCIRRVGGLLLEFRRPVHLERLYILDFFFANAPLLHRVTMTADVRNAFRDLAIPKPDKVFLSYPASPLLFHQMESAQTSALRALSGKGLLNTESFADKSAQPSTLGSALFVDITNRTDGAQERALARFLVNQYSASHDNGMVACLLKLVSLTAGMRTEPTLDFCAFAYAASLCGCSRPTAVLQRA